MRRPTNIRVDLGLRHVGDRCFGAACMEQSAVLLASGHQLYEQFNSFTAVVDNSRQAKLTEMTFVLHRVTSTIYSAPDKSNKF